LTVCEHNTRPWDNIFHLLNPEQSQGKDKHRGLWQQPVAQWRFTAWNSMHSLKSPFIRTTTAGTYSTW
jgi:hypothetical protein